MNNFILDPYLHKINQKNSTRIFQICIAPSCCVMNLHLHKGWALSGLHGDVVAINQSILSSLYQLTLAVWDPGSTLNTESSKTI